MGPVVQRRFREDELPRLAVPLTEPGDDAVPAGRVLGSRRRRGLGRRVGCLVAGLARHDSTGDDGRLDAPPAMATRFLELVSLHRAPSFLTEMAGDGRARAGGS